MTVKQLLRVLLIAMLAFVLVACGNDDSESSNTADNTAEQPTEPSTAEVTSDNSADISLTQTISTTDAAGGTLTLRYPETWFAREFNGPVALTNEESVFTAEALNSGQITGSLLVFPTEMLAIDNDPTPENVLNSFIQTMTTEDPQASFTLNDPESFTVNGMNAVIQTGAGSDAQGTLEMANIIVDSGAGFVLLNFQTPEGEMAQYEAILRAISGTVTYEFIQAEG